MVILALVYVILLVVIVLILISVGSRIGEQAASLAARLLEAVKQPDPLGNMPMPGWLEFARPKLAVFLKGRLSDLGEHVLPLLSSVVSAC